MKWVMLKRYCEMTGVTVPAFKCKIQTGKLAQGVHYKLVDRRIWVNTEAMDKWVERGAA